MTDDYVTLYQSLLTMNDSGSNILALFFLFAMRMYPVIAMAPYLGAKVLPHPVKVGMGICFFAIMIPKILIVTTTPVDFNSKLLVLAVKEFFIGLTLSVMCMVPFWAAEIAGLFTDHQRGGASLMINDPTIQSQSSPLGTLYNLTLITLFYAIGGPFLFIETIIETYDMVPPDQFLSRIFFNQGSPFWDTIQQVFGKTVILGIQLASPALLVILMTDMFLGIINRMAPQVMITFLGMPLKSLLGLMVVCLGWTLLTKQLAVEAHVWYNQIREVVRGYSVGI